MNFFESLDNTAPLADKMRPKTLEDFIGQEHILGQGMLLRRAIQANRLGSCIFYGPPGCGKTSLANVIANVCDINLARLNAVSSGVAELREVIKNAKEAKITYGKVTYLLLDECHRWSKAQSDAILPAIESGVIHMIGTTTENPYISLTPALLSRCRIFQFNKITKEQIITVIKKAVSDKQNGYGTMKISISSDALNHWAEIANGDVRNALNALELAVLTTKPDKDGVINIDISTAEQSIQKRVLACDESYFYDMLSAFCKSLRGSDPDAALAWAGKLIVAGADPRIIARRTMVHASEDVGLADPMALLQAAAGFDAVEKIGPPECYIPLAQAIIYVATAPKSNSVLAIHSAIEAAKDSPNEPVPAHLRDTSYYGADKLGSGEGYMYPHSFENHYINQQYMPDSQVDNTYYAPSDQGYEKIIKTWLEKLNNI